MVVVVAAGKGSVVTGVLPMTGAPLVDSVVTPGSADSVVGRLVVTAESFGRSIGAEAPLSPEGSSANPAATAKDPAASSAASLF